MTDIVLTKKNYKNAFQCTKDGGCPQSSDSDGCPMWLDFKRRNNEDGAEDRVSGCGPAVLLAAQIEGIAATIMTTNGVQRARKELDEDKKGRMDGMKAVALDLERILRGLHEVKGLAEGEAEKKRGVFSRMLGGK